MASSTNAAFDLFERYHIFHVASSLLMVDDEDMLKEDVYAKLFVARTVK